MHPLGDVYQSLIVELPQQVGNGALRQTDLIRQLVRGLGRRQRVEDLGP
jgi:hypothetical protein